MKKNFLYSIVAILIIISPSIISAQSYDFNYARDQAGRVLDSTIGIASPVLEVLVGDYATSEFFFHKMLLLVLLIIISKNVLDRTPIGENNKKASILISIIISILAVRFISENEFFEAIFIQYGVFGIAISAILPMVIFFYFIHHTQIGTYGRKVFWSLYIITMVSIWISKSNNLPETANLIYGLTLLAALIFIFFDRSIHRYFGSKEYGKFEKDSINKAKRKLKRDAQELWEDYRRGIIPRKDYEKELKEIREKIKKLSEE
jgi:hypothetical protein